MKLFIPIDFYSGPALGWRITGLASSNPKIDFRHCGGTSYEDTFRSCSFNCSSTWITVLKMYKKKAGKKKTSSILRYRPPIGRSMDMELHSKPEENYKSLWTINSPVLSCCCMLAGRPIGEERVWCFCGGSIKETPTPKDSLISRTIDIFITIKSAAGMGDL